MRTGGGGFKSGEYVRISTVYFSLMEENIAKEKNGKLKNANEWPKSLCNAELKNANQLIVFRNAEVKIVIRRFFVK